MGQFYIAMTDTYGNLQSRFRAWALTQSSIRAVIIVGSQARSDHPADEWSDLDLVVFATDTTAFLDNAAWLETFGRVRLAVSHSFGAHDREWLALYDDGRKLDVAFLSIDAHVLALQNILDAFPYPIVLQRGVRVLLDKTGSPETLQLPQLAVLPPDQIEFTTALQHMWFEAIKTAKFIRRADLWRAKQLCDGDLKQHLLVMIEWQAATRGDVWYDGRFLSEWADRAVLAALPDTFALYQAADLQRALLATLDLYRQLAQDVAAQFGFTYPVDTDRFVVEHIQTILRDNT